MNQQNIKKLATAVSISILLIGCGGSKTDEIKKVVTKQESAVRNPASFEKIDVTTGEGIEATEGKNVSVHYTGWLYAPGAENKRGSKFDSSVDRGQPFQFPLGAGRVIKGWDQGVAGMKVGGKRTLIIPPEMATAHAERVAQSPPMQP